MTAVASRELRNRTAELLRRAEAGEELIITVAGRPVAVLRPIGDRPRWMSREQFLREVVPHQADTALAAELHDLAPGTTDDDPLP